MHRHVASTEAQSNFCLVLIRKLLWQEKSSSSSKAFEHEAVRPEGCISSEDEGVIVGRVREGRQTRARHEEVLTIRAAASFNFLSARIYASPLLAWHKTNTLGP